MLIQVDINKWYKSLVTYTIETKNHAAFHTEYYNYSPSNKTQGYKKRFLGN